MREKSHALRQQYGSSLNLDGLLNSVTKLLPEYKNVPYRDLRILFFIEDLLNFNQLTNGLHRQKILTVIISQILKRNVFLVMPALYVIFMKLKRQSLKSK
jgi:hypothetical protein